MTKRLEVVPIYDVDAIAGIWGYISQDVEEVLSHSTGEESKVVILNKLLAKQMLLFIGYYDKDYCGFVTAHIVSNINCTPYMVLAQTFIKRGSPTDIWYEGADLIGETALQLGCKELRMYTTRSRSGSAYEKRLTATGWHRGNDEWIKEV